MTNININKIEINKSKQRQTRVDYINSNSTILISGIFYVLSTQLKINHEFLSHNYFSFRQIEIYICKHRPKLSQPFIELST